MKKFNILFIGAMIAAIIYLLLIGIYTKISTNPIIFFASLVIAIIVPIIVCLALKFVLKINFDNFTITCIGLLYCMEILLLSVFGPTFIDRSISYHLAFYAVEESKVYIDDIEDAFSKDIFEKRLNDAVVTGFLKENSDGSLSPTIKSEILYAILKPVGELTGSMDTYQEMKDAIDESNRLFDNKEID